jgi:lysophospholipase L1-like esterase
VILIVYPTLEQLSGKAPADSVPRLEAIADELGWPLVDLTPAFARQPAALFLPGDPVHPSAEGYARAAALAADALIERRLLP